MKKKYWIVSVIAAITAIYFIYDYQRPRLIDMEYKSLIYSTESNFVSETNVFIKGNLYKSLFGKDEFIGVITADKDLKYEIQLKQVNKSYFGLLTTNDGNFGIVNSIGSVMASNDLAKVWIQLDDINERYNIKNGYISGPAGTTDEANEIAKSIMEDT